MKPDWTPREVDRYMDKMLRGDPISKIADDLGKSKDETKAFFRYAFYNRRYQSSSKRLWRGDRPKTDLEKRLLRRYLRKNYPMEVMCDILQRKPNQLNRDFFGEDNAKKVRETAPITDALVAHHFLYHIAKKPIIPDQVYDAIKAEELEFGNGAATIAAISQARKVIDYPAHLRYLAYYMLYKHMVASGVWEEDKLPFELSNQLTGRETATPRR